MEAFHQALERDPTTDLLSIFSKRYVAAHRVGQYANLSEAARLNFETVDQLQDGALSQPEANLRDILPADYDRLFKWAMPKDENKDTPATSSQPAQQLREPLDWLRKKIEPVHTASIIYPLSTKALTLLNQHPASDGSLEKQSLIEALKYRLLNSEIIFELSARRGAVLRCSEDLVIKTFSSNRDFTEYHNLQYLAENLNGIFSRLRSLRQEDGTELGGVRGEGVKDYRVMETLAFKGITTARGFDELQFSAKHRASPSYVKLLRSFLAEDNKMLEGSVFTHGDLKKSNIMVQEDPGNAGFFVVTGIIDWEDGGFYPEYYESTTLSNGQSILSDDDWYLYAPHCISALWFPVRWLVDRLWGNLLWNWRIDIVR
ncbi:unnamed protein product [Penicillium salamii]|nr:unnamed protein product [Penicillium salamii]